MVYILQLETIFGQEQKKLDSFQHFAQPHILHDGKQNYTIFFVPHK